MIYDNIAIINNNRDIFCSGTYQNQDYIVNFEQFLPVASVAECIEYWTMNGTLKRREFEPPLRIFGFFSSKISEVHCSLLLQYLRYYYP